MIHRAKKTEAGWKVERLLSGCGACGRKERWQTILYLYYSLPLDEQHAIATTIAELLNSQEGGEPNA